jgi:hypothetical protein
MTRSQTRSKENAVGAPERSKSVLRVGQNRGGFLHFFVPFVLLVGRRPDLPTKSTKGTKKKITGSHDPLGSHEKKCEASRTKLKLALSGSVSIRIAVADKTAIRPSMDRRFQEFKRDFA